MKYTYFSIVSILIFAFMVSGCVFADSKITWQKISKQIEELPDDNNRCEKVWNILWPLAKKGNMSARYMLLVGMMPPPDMNPILAPGNSGDIISSHRDVAIMAVHSHAYKAENGAPSLTYDNEYFEPVYKLYHAVGFDEINSGKRFLKCLDERKENCSSLAVEGGLIPSFKKYSSQIDTFIKNGEKARCD